MTTCLQEWWTSKDIQRMYLVGQKKARSMINESINLAKQKGLFVPETKTKIVQMEIVLERYPTKKA